ncbi:unnamed protein product [Linum trigynum]|uniref:Uncharacterized protein n=1 Tax=Linum trigynum TaxID=586398 RepID=A0AAV2GS15_9ROSI
MYLANHSGSGGQKAIPPKASSWVFLPFPRFFFFFLPILVIVILFLGSTGEIKARFPTPLQLPGTPNLTSPQAISPLRIETIPSQLTCSTS